jgi:hypothetical protein
MSDLILAQKNVVYVFSRICFVCFVGGSFFIYVIDFIYKHSCPWTISMHNGVRVFQQ